MYLTLPLPTASTRTAEVTIVHVDGSAPPTLHAIAVPKPGTISDLYAAIGQVGACKYPQPTFHAVQRSATNMRPSSGRFLQCNAALGSCAGQGYPLWSVTVASKAVLHVGDTDGALMIAKLTTSDAGLVLATC